MGRGQRLAVRQGRDRCGRRRRRRAGAVNPAGTGTKVAARYDLTVAPGATETVLLRLAKGARRRDAGAGRRRRSSPPGIARGRRVLRHADRRDARPTTRRSSSDRPSPGSSGASSATTTTSRNGSSATRPARRHRMPAGTAATRDWRELNNDDVLSMPDSWEYPWYAAWDLAFHCCRWPSSTRPSPNDQLLL